MKIEWSREASVMLRGQYVNAFAAHTYFARIEENERVFALILPPGAARQTEEYWQPRVYRAARFVLDTRALMIFGCEWLETIEEDIRRAESRSQSIKEGKGISDVRES